MSFFRTLNKRDFTEKILHQFQKWIVLHSDGKIEIPKYVEHRSPKTREIYWNTSPYSFIPVFDWEPLFPSEKENNKRDWEKDQKKEKQEKEKQAIKIETGCYSIIPIILPSKSGLDDLFYVGFCNYPHFYPQDPVMLGRDQYRLCTDIMNGTNPTVPIPPRVRYELKDNFISEVKSNIPNVITSHPATYINGICQGTTSIITDRNVTITKYFTNGRLQSAKYTKIISDENRNGDKNKNTIQLSYSYQDGHLTNVMRYNKKGLLIGSYNYLRGNLHGKCSGREVVGTFINGVLHGDFRINHCNIRTVGTIRKEAGVNFSDRKIKHKFYNEIKLTPDTNGTFEGNLTVSQIDPPLVLAIFHYDEFGRAHGTCRLYDSTTPPQERNRPMIINYYWEGVEKSKVEYQNCINRRLKVLQDFNLFRDVGLLICDYME